MSFSKTLDQFRARTKTVTRRLGWERAKAGDRVTAVEKAQGLKKGEHQVVIGEIEIVSVRRERLDAITTEDCEREGFPGWSPAEFAKMFGAPPDTEVTRIEFRYVDGWGPISTAPEGVLVETCIAGGTRHERNVAPLRRLGLLWYVDDESMYVYYSPTHWREMTP
jgi:hypothetical protein